MNTGEPLENDPILIEAFRQGKDEALRAIFRSYYQRLCFFANKIIENQEDSADIVSEIFIKLFQKHKDFETLLNVKAFLYVSTRNSCLDWLKSNRIRRTISLSDNEQVYNLPELTEDQPIWMPYKAELLNKIWLAVQTLPPQRRKVFRMRYYEHMRPIDIATELNISKATVSEHLTKSIEHIRSQLFLISIVILITSIICFLIK
jgi:RNA polymerase sigma-70 factor (family 1)